MTLRPHLPDLVQLLDVNLLSPYLVAEDLQTPEELLNLHASNTRESRVLALVDSLEKRGPRAYQRFRRALEKSTTNGDTHLGHEDLLRILPEDELLRSSDSGVGLLGGNSCESDASEVGTDDAPSARPLDVLKRLWVRGGEWIERVQRELRRERGRTAELRAALHQERAMRTQERAEVFCCLSHHSASAEVRIHN